MIKKPTLVILAAGKVTSKLPFMASMSDCPALIPLGVKSSLLHQISFYQNKVAKIIILTNKEHLKEVSQEIYPELVKNQKNYLQIITCKTKNVNKTLEFFCKNAIFKNSEDYIVNLSTSIPEKLISKNNFGISKEGIIQQNWSSISLKKKTIEKINYRKESKKIISNAFIGIFRLSGQKLKKIINLCKSDDQIEILDLYIKKYKKVNLEYQKWLDVGHSANYFQTKKQLIVSRSFNRIKINKTKGTIIKVSADFKKIENENLFIDKLPENLKIFFPRIIERKKNSSNASFEMEYCAFPTLSETSLFWNIDKAEWKKCFETMSNILSQFKNHTSKFSLNQYVQFYYTRLIKRTETYIGSLDVEYKNLFLAEEININNQRLKGLLTLLPLIKQKIISIYNKEDFCIMHGDFCFNNILYEPYTSALKLIDVRGSFNSLKSTIYGDQKYDYAKLSHSAVHFYDYLIAGQYKFHKNNKKLFYEFLIKENYKLISDECNNQIRKNGYNIKDIDFIVGISFLSMTALHKEDKLRQMVMFLHGITILNKCLK
jgi:hypothetical protein